MEEGKGEIGGGEGSARMEEGGGGGFNSHVFWHVSFLCTKGAYWIAFTTAAVFFFFFFLSFFLFSFFLLFSFFFFLFSSFSFPSSLPLPPSKLVNSSPNPIWPRCQIHLHLKVSRP